MYSVAFEEKNGRQYYRYHREKYYLEGKSTVLPEIPRDSADRMQFYYYESGNGWAFDTPAYEEYTAATEKEQEKQKEDTGISQEEMIKAIMELAQNQSDLEDALIELAAVVGGE